MKRGGLRWAGAAAFGLAFVALMVAERRRPLRRRVDAEPSRRLARNATLGTTALVASAAVEWALVKSAGAWADRHRVGMIPRLPLPHRGKQLLGFLALDYSIYLWHVLNHRVPALWRFHLVHHVDRDLDTSTGVRFHFGEMALTASLRAVQIFCLGVDRRTLALWQRLLTLSVLFHHSNLRLPFALEQPLSLVIVTPRMHGEHHSVRREEMDCNLSSLLSLWDYLHGTRRMRARHDDLVIGVPGWSDARLLTVGRLLAMPFRRALSLRRGAQVE